MNRDQRALARIGLALERDSSGTVVRMFYSRAGQRNGEAQVERKAAVGVISGVGRVVPALPLPTEARELDLWAGAMPASRGCSPEIQQGRQTQ